ncbi:hypothetical protein PV367_20965, partial [Streptomyces europaeiscabiei]|nr:hypothetical protein [Streptomyces europaeiscabiei]
MPWTRSTAATVRAPALCEHAFADLRGRGTRLVEIGTGGDAFHAPARALYESLGRVPFPAAHHYRQLGRQPSGARRSPNRAAPRTPAPPS